MSDPIDAYLKVFKSRLTGAYLPPVFQLLQMTFPITPHGAIR